MDPALRDAHVDPALPLLRPRSAWIALLAALIGVVAGFVAELLAALIGFFTNLAFYGRVSFEFVEPSDHILGPWVMIVPVIGGLIVGVMARFGSSAIRGHGIPEAMEQVLLNKSRIPARVTWLKPLSSAITIGTGGPFGAEGPIIATGGSLGSLLGQLLSVTAAERKVLLAGGAAAGMAATFGSPVAAVLLAIELLLFELRPRSVIPVSIATCAATTLRYAIHGGAPVFAMPEIATATPPAMVGFLLLGLILGLVAVAVTRLVYGIEDAFERLPVHWMWWPAIGAVAVGVVGYFAPLTLGVGYSNIERIVSGEMALSAIAFLCVMKFVSWSISLGSGTSGGTLAPLFIIGGGVGTMLAAGLNDVFGLGIDLRLAGLVGMAAMFAGASRAFLASVVFAFEITGRPQTLLPLLVGCAGSYFVGLLIMRNSIMTEKIVRRGVRVPAEYSSDFLDQRLVGDHCSRTLRTVPASWKLGELRRWLETGESGTHHGFPVLDDGLLVGVVTRRDVLETELGNDAQVTALLQRQPAVAFTDQSLREAADTMVATRCGRLPVVTRDEPRKVVGMLTRSDLLTAHRRRLEEDREAERSLDPRELLPPGLRPR